MPKLSPPKQTDSFVLERPFFPQPAGLRLISAEKLPQEEGTPVRIMHPDAGLRLVFTPDRPTPPGWYELELRFPPAGLVDVVAQFAFADSRVMWLRLPLYARNHFVAHFRLEAALDHVALIVTGSGRLTGPVSSRFERIGLSRQLASATLRAVDIYRRDGFGVFASGLSYLWRLTRPGSIVISRGSASRGGESSYATWIRLFDEVPENDRVRHEERMACLSDRPLITIAAELSSTEPLVLDRLACSVTEQIYPCWQLALAAPAELQRAVGPFLAARGVDASRLRMVNMRPNSAENLNALLAVSEGDYLLPLAPGTLLRPHALLELALTVQKVPFAELVYADEDAFDATGKRSDWQFKPAWSPNLLDCRDYLGRIVLIRCGTLRALGGWRAEARDYRHDLFLRFGLSVEQRSIVHVAKVLLHGPGVADRTVFPEPTVQRTITMTGPRVSLIIPTRDNADVLETCLCSIRARTSYNNYEIVVIDNGSVEEKTKRLFAKLASDATIRILPMPEPFNFSKLNNAAAYQASGDILGFVNNDIEVTRENWLSEMVALAALPQAGCVGAKLLYSDGRIQHAGIVIGIGGVAGHGHRFAERDDPGYLNRLQMVQNVSAVTAACLLVRKQVFDHVEGFDEDLTVAFNDVDFCLKVRAAGYLNLWTPFAELIHHESLSRGRDLTPAKARRFSDEFATMQRRWGADLLSDPYYSPHLTYDREDFSLRLR